MSHKILIVADEPLFGWSTANALGRAGYNPEVVMESGEDAVERIKRGDIELVISDYRLPKMDGIDIATKVKKISRSLPVIIIGNDEELDDAVAGSATGIDYIIDKLFNVNEIVNLVGEIFEHSASGMTI